MAVDIQFHAARGGVKIPDGINGHFKKSSSQSVLPESGEYINLLQVKQVVAFLLDRDVAGCLSVLLYKVIVMAFFFHLPSQAFGRIHPVHHVIDLFGSQYLAVGIGKCFRCQFIDQGNISCCCFSGSNHQVLLSLVIHLRIYILSRFFKEIPR